MSHFMVMVVGDDVKEALAPYHEYECTGIKDKYVVPVDRTNEVQDLLAEGFGEVTEPLSEESEELDTCLLEAGVQGGIYETEEEALAADEKWGYCVFSEGRVQKAVEFTNPNKKWDWWVIGGRYTRHLLLKDGTRADSARKKDIDFETMERGVREQAEKAHDAVHKSLPGEILGQFKDMSAEELNKRFRERDIPDPLRGVQLNISGQQIFRPYYPEDMERILKMSREEYSVRQSKLSWVPFAMVDDKGWLSRGDMGWWGAFTPGNSPFMEYVKQVSERISAAHDDTMITVVDCHI